MVGSFSTGCAVPKQEPNEINERHEAVANGIEDYRPFWVSEAFHVNKESKKSEECGAEADNGAHADEALGKFNVVWFKEHVGARWSTVLGTQEGRALARFGL